MVLKGLFFLSLIRLFSPNFLILLILWEVHTMHPDSHIYHHFLYTLCHVLKTVNCSWRCPCTLAWVPFHWSMVNPPGPHPSRKQIIPLWAALSCQQLLHSNLPYPCWLFLCSVLTQILFVLSQQLWIHLYILNHATNLFAPRCGHMIASGQ